MSEGFPYDALVLQGGGARCVFGLGFLAEAAPALSGLGQIAAVSAGAAVACAHLGGSHERALELMISTARRFTRPGRSVLGRLLSGERPTAHYDAYRSFVEALIDPECFLRIRGHGTRLRFILTRCQGLSRFRPVAAAVAILAAHRQKTPRSFVPVIIEAAECASREELITAILASSAVPLLTPLPLRDGCATVDGGLIEPLALAALAGECRPLAILSEPRLVGPLSRPVPMLAPTTKALSMWSLTDEEGMRALYEEGRQAAQRLLRSGPLAQFVAG